MATATITPGSEQIAEWVSGEVIDFLDDLHTDVECRVEAFAGRVSTTITEAALQAARAGLTTMLADLGVRNMPTPPDSPEQNVLPLQARTATRAPRSSPAPSSPTVATPTAPAGARAPRAPRDGGIASEVVAFLTAHPGETFTAGGIAKELDGNRSSGAVDAAMKRMLDRGQVVLASDKPRKYALPQG